MYRDTCHSHQFIYVALIQDVTQMETNGTRHILVLEDEAGSLISVDYKTLIKCCKLQHAWARTIHTYQVC